jgi:hypothetical protein
LRDSVRILRDDAITWIPVGAGEPLRFDVARFFASVVDRGAASLPHGGIPAA